MAVQPEQVLEDNLITQLVTLGYQVAQITDEKSLLANLKQQLEKLNSLKVKLSDNEFRQVLNALSKGSVFEKAKTLRDRLQVNRDDGSAPASASCLPPPTSCQESCMQQVWIS